MIKSFLCFFAFTTASVQLGHSTSIVIINRGDLIVVAADSKEGSNTGQSKITCKILKIGSLYWSFSGFLDDDNTDYHVPIIVRTIYKKGMGADAMLLAFENKAVPKLKRTLNSIQAASPEKFEKVKNHPLEIAFWGFEEGKPVIAFNKYTTHISKNRIVLSSYDRGIVDCRKDVSCINGRLTTLGVDGDIRQYAMSHQPWITDPSVRGIAQTASFFVQKSIKQAPDSVGPPINVIAFKPDGSFDWVVPSECCNGKVREAADTD